LNTINDLLVYVVDPSIYDEQPFLGWDSQELTSLTDFTGKVVTDVGAGTGRLAFVVARQARAVYADEPVANLRQYLMDEARGAGLQNVFPVDGLITRIPFDEGFADVTMGGHVFGEDPEQEYHEMARVTKSGGMVILCPGTNDEDNETHSSLTSEGFAWSRFEEPADDMMRKYWKVI
jgi:ubiquinone/menaquinone biosynthesis C-methylase UbiE